MGRKKGVDPASPPSYSLRLPPGAEFVFQPGATGTGDFAPADAGNAECGLQRGSRSRLCALVAFLRIEPNWWGYCFGPADKPKYTPPAIRAVPAIFLTRRCQQ